MNAVTNFRRTADWLARCGKEPRDERALSVQIACHIEEFVEFLEQIEVEDSGIPPDIAGTAISVLAQMANEAKRGESRMYIADRVAALDALCDMEVTGNGVAYVAGFRKEEADAVVLGSNEAKLVNGKPVILPGGKIGKPEGWKPPDLLEYAQ